MARIVPQPGTADSIGADVDVQRPNDDDLVAVVDDR
jgi:hypothetical protein